MIDGIDIPCTYKNGKQYVPKSGYVKTKSGEYEKRGNIKFTLRIKGDNLVPLFTLAQYPKVTIPAMKLHKEPDKVIDWATPPIYLEVPCSGGRSILLSLDTESGHVITEEVVHEGSNLPSLCLEGDFDGIFDDYGDFIITPKDKGSLKLLERPNDSKKIRYRIAVLDYRTKEVKVFEREYSKTQDVETELTREGILHDDTEYMTTVVGENGLKVTIE